MRSPAGALLWEIGRRHRSNIAAIVLLTIVALALDTFDAPDPASPDTGESSPLIVLLAMAAFFLLFAVFNYTESDGRGAGQFPRRLFTLPVTSLRLVAVPVVAAIVSTELLYLLWMQPLSRDGSAGVPFVAVLLGACAVLYLSALWTLERAGSLRLMVVGALMIAIFAIGLLPSFPPTPPPWWRSEPALAGLVAAVAALAFLVAWRHVARSRAGGGRRTRAAGFAGRMAGAAPARSRVFASAAAAHFWFEWRLSGMVLPALVAAVFLVVVMPLSWMARGSAADTFRLLLAALAVPAVLAVPVGMAFSKPTFWSEDLSVPPFVAVRPLSCEELVAIKLRVAAVSVGLSWLVVFVMLTLWLSLWGETAAVRQFSPRVWLLMALAAIVLTWRFMVSRLWTGLSGIRRLFVGSVLSTVIVVVGGIGFEANLLPGWVLADRSRIATLSSVLAIAVAAKFAIAAYAWRWISGRYVMAYLPIWLVGTASFLALALEAGSVRGVVIPLALLAVPVARLGLAPLLLARNRHR